MMRFEVLGPVRVWREGRELDPGFPQQRALLALLLAHAGRTVPASEIMDVLWAERPPASAPNVVRRYIGALRRLLEPGLPPRAPGRRLPRSAGGHLLEAATEEVDLLRFRELTRQGKRAVATGRPETAARRFVLALEEWRGPVAMGAPASVREHVQFTAVQRELLETSGLAADAALLCGRADQVLPALRRATAHDPLDESLHARLVLALAACGLQAEALGAYEGIRRRLSRELGLTPGAELAAAHTRVLRQDVGRRSKQGPVVRPGRPLTATGTHPAPDTETRPPTPATGAPSRAGGGGDVAAAVPSARLPSASAFFVGRGPETEWLEEAGSAAGVVLVTGMAGTGKSTLAVHWAHRAADRFPDGRLFVALRGSDPDRSAVRPADALRGMLTALGVPAPRTPDGVDALTGAYRTLLARRRVLVVLDDAAGTAQLAPLLPAGPGSLALVTSRHALPGLVASGARPLRLAPLSAGDAHALLARRIGAARVAAEARAADEIVARCGGLPLALTGVAAHAAGRPDIPLAAVAAGLRESHGGLGALATTREAFLSSYRLLAPDGRRLFRLLPRHEGPGITAAGAAVLAGLPVRRARLLLGVLADAHLLTETAPGRYALHGLLRAFATERAQAEGRAGGS
ncbi:BTAD domain-containing putative transcriptional regulator [Streptomyces sp. NPDC051445]|uniref:AfsR/SARP family transcriptional regulator n=1 Tax=Streptomyces sp. NPDC051445 TaxID=3365653 RepID=UPI0037B0C389